MKSLKMYAVIKILLIFLISCLQLYMINKFVNSKSTKLKDYSSSTQSFEF